MCLGQSFSRLVGAQTEKKHGISGVRVRSGKLKTLKGEFEMLKTKDGSLLKIFCKVGVNQMRLYGENFQDSRVVEKMLISLPERFEEKVSAIEESCDLKKLSIVELIS